LEAAWYSLYSLDGAAGRDIFFFGFGRAWAALFANAGRFRL
jgi:hypothetical protein